MNLYLIDGNSLMNTSFFGTVGHDWVKGDKEVLKKRVMQTSGGVLTNAAYTMTDTLLKLMVPNQANFMAVMFDVNRETIFRREIYPEYKGTRGESDEYLKAQFPIMKEILEVMGIPYFEVETFEADDIIGTFARKFEKHLPVKIITRDKDAFQIISEDTCVWFKDARAAEWRKEYREAGGEYSQFVQDKFFEFDVKSLKHFYDLEPKQVIDWKALEGDSSDNIPGVAGVGPKAAVPLIKYFGTIEKIYEYVESVSEEEAKVFFKEIGITRSPYKKLIEGKENAFLSKKLATIVEDMEHFDHLDIMDLKINPDTQKTLEVFRKYEFKKFK